MRSGRGQRARRREQSARGHDHVISRPVPFDFISQESAAIQAGTTVRLTVSAEDTDEILRVRHEDGAGSVADQRLDAALA